jgi:hypothetical protein
VAGLPSPPAPQGGWVGKLGGSPAVNRRVGEPRKQMMREYRAGHRTRIPNTAEQRRPRPRRDPTIFFNPMA